MLLPKSQNFSLDEKERNCKVSIKLFKTAYFMARKKWTVKENFQDLVELINQEIGDDEVQKHLNESGKNATYLSHFSAEEYLEIIIDLIEKKRKWIIYLQAVIFNRYQMKALNWLFLPDLLTVALIEHLRNLSVCGNLANKKLLQR